MHSKHVRDMGLNMTRMSSRTGREGEGGRSKRHSADPCIMFSCVVACRRHLRELQDEEKAQKMFDLEEEKLERAKRGRERADREAAEAEQRAAEALLEAKNLQEMAIFMGQAAKEARADADVKMSVLCVFHGLQASTV